MIDHDQRFKTILQEFLPEFFQLFFPHWYARLDFTQLDFLTNEVFPDPTQGQRKILDLVARIRLRDDSGNELAILHIEIESPDSMTLLRERFWKYYSALRLRHGCKVLPIALFLNVGKEGIGREIYTEGMFEEDTLTFRFWYVGLPALEAATYRTGTSHLGMALSALMHQPREERPANTAAVVQSLLQSPLNKHQQHLLLDCALAYGPLDQQQRQETEQLINQAIGANQMPVPPELFPEWKDYFHEKGRSEGAHDTSVRLVTTLLDTRFSPLPPFVPDRLRGMTTDELEKLVPLVVTASSLEELGLSDS